MSKALTHLDRHSTTSGYTGKLLRAPPPLLLWFTLLAPSLSYAHLIDEVAESVLITVETTDGRTFEMDFAFHLQRLERYHEQAEQLGLPQARTDAAFSARLQRSFTVRQCPWKTIDSTNAGDTNRSRRLARGRFVAYRLTAECSTPPSVLTLTREDHDRSKTRTTLYIALKQRGQTTRRFLLPPRLASLDIPLKAKAQTPPPSSTTRREGPDPQTLRRPGDPIRTDGLPAPKGARDGQEWAPPPLGLLWLWVEAGVKHLVTGLDHLGLLLALVWLCASMGQLAWRTLMFSVGHIAAMAVALTFHVPASIWLESAVALTLVWAASALWRRDPERAPPGGVSLAVCGVVHGLAFGADLAEMLGSSEALLWPLVGFGLGLDVTQLVYVTALWWFMSVLNSFLMKRELVVNRRVQAGAVALFALALLVSMWT